MIPHMCTRCPEQVLPAITYFQSPSLPPVQVVFGGFTLLTSYASKLLSSPQRPFLSPSPPTALAPHK
jgi:hypothetical protein